MEGQAGNTPFVIEAEEADRQRRASGLTIQSFLASLVEPTRALARPPISAFRVGAVGLGPSGCIYRGVNLEFPGLPLHHSVHAEQFLVANAAQRGEKSLTYLAVSAAPCGHCRQFLQELRGSGEVQVLIVDSHAETQALSQFLPHRFGPHDLLEDEFPLMLEPRENGLCFKSHNPLAYFLPSGHLASKSSAYDIASCLTNDSHNNDSKDQNKDSKDGNKDSKEGLPSSLPRRDLVSDCGQFCDGSLDANNIMKHELSADVTSQNGGSVQEDNSFVGDLDAQELIEERKLDSLRVSALRAANSSYAPYSHCPSGLSIFTTEGKIFSGSYLESAAFNPSLSPLQAAIVSFISHGGDHYEDIVHAVLVERDGASVQHAETIRLALDKISPGCSLHIYNDLLP
ncbi:hypothetical protein O6H91_23G006500 [Diphasiastrum complanatum]|uniref:Uncharacterized protein n=1 Tax=Diphasiastrum complanatum TaxID=34168 RepID=A0ACC2A7T1_DIPCM|nr:hypothetical protein O6H91_23G006500 [Diphasiastrum complanatum]